MNAAVHFTDIIVPVLNLKDFTRQFLESALIQQNVNIIIIDNGSNEETASYLSDVALNNDNVVLIRNSTNRGYVKAINQGLQEAKSSTIFLANNDTIMPSGLISQLRAGLGQYDIVSALSNNIGLSNDPRLIQYNFTSIEDLENFSERIQIDNANQHRQLDFVFGHCLMMKREVFESIGFLDERFGIGNYDDADYCRRAIKNKFQVGILESAFIYHFCHKTFDAEGIDLNQLMIRNRRKFYKKWQNSL